MTNVLKVVLLSFLLMLLNCRITAYVPNRIFRRTLGQNINTKFLKFEIARPNRENQHVNVVRFPMSTKATSDPMETVPFGGKVV